MTIDPLIVTAALALLAALGSLFLYFLRAFATGDLMSKNVVPRADFDAQCEINASYPPAIDRLTAAVVRLTESVDAMRINGKGPT